MVIENSLPEKNGEGENAKKYSLKITKKMNKSVLSIQLPTIKLNSIKYKFSYSWLRTLINSKQSLQITQKIALLPDNQVKFHKNFMQI